ncbi:translin associated factor X isoform X1 [Rhodnius prolixus]|uniref:translin associated factor X isoform X1 n=2 Tax=Rhodnius prolixus TaxID=13249 RepID=UPI003D187FCA
MGPRRKVREKQNDGKEDTVVMVAFRKFAAELDTKHDKHERIVKISRDITIESKRLIFSLHSLLRNDDITEASGKIKEGLRKIILTHFTNITLELENEDPYQYLRAFSPGLQEFIEAITLYSFIVKSGTLFTWEDVKEELNVHVDIRRDKPNGPPEIIGTRRLQGPVPLTEYLLGLEDLTGELMRLAIGQLGAGKFKAALKTTTFVKYVYTGLLLLSHVQSREFGKKLSIVRQSLDKMEYACYVMHVRGSEVQAHPSQFSSTSMLLPLSQDFLNI